MDFPYSASKAQNTECTEIKRAYVRVENGEWWACLYIPRKVFFYVWLTAMPPLVKAPLWQQLFCFNGPVLCQRGKFFYKKRLSYVAAGMVPSPSGVLFSAVSCRCLMKGSWQSIICSACSQSRPRQGRTRLWWMMLRCFQLLTWKWTTTWAIRRTAP